MHGREPLLWTASTPPHQVTWPLRTVPFSSPRKSLFISFKVSAARTHMCMHTFTLTPPHVLLLRGTHVHICTHIFLSRAPLVHTYVYTQSCTHKLLPLFTHGGHCLPFLLGPEVAFVLLGAGRQACPSLGASGVVGEVPAAAGPSLCFP